MRGIAPWLVVLCAAPGLALGWARLLVLLLGACREVCRLLLAGRSGSRAYAFALWYGPRVEALARREAELSAREEACARRERDVDAQERRHADHVLAWARSHGSATRSGKRRKVA